MKLVVGVLVCAFASFVAGASPDEYKKIAKEFLTNTIHLESHNNIAAKNMIGKEAVEFDVDISLNPKLKLFAKISKKKELYTVKISLKEPKSIKGLNILIVLVEKRPDLKAAFAHALKSILQSFNPTRSPLEKYRRAAKAYRDTASYLDAQANIFLNLIAGNKEASHIVSYQKT